MESCKAAFPVGVWMTFEQVVPFNHLNSKSMCAYEYIIPLHLIRAFFFVVCQAPFNLVILPIPLENSGLGLDLPHSQPKSRYNYVVFLLLIIIYGLAMPKLFPGINYEIKSFMTTTIDVLVGLCGCTAVLIVQLIFSINQRSFIRTICKFIQFDRLADEKLSKIYLLKDEKRRVISILLICTTIAITRLVVEYATCPEWAVVVIYGMSEVFLGCYMLNFGLILMMLQKRLESLHQALFELSELRITSDHEISIFPGGISDDEIIFNHVTVIREARNILYEISFEISDLYSFPITFALTYYCGSIIYNSYIFAMQVRASTYGVNLWLTCNSILWLLQIVCPIILVSVRVQALTERMRMTGVGVFKVMSVFSSSRKINVQMIEFASELLHKKVYFTAYGMFPLDCTFLHSVFSTVVTYLLILLQFQPAKDSNG